MRTNAFRYAAIVALGGAIFGLDAALISGTVRFITEEFGLSDWQIGSVVSAPGFGVLFALLATGFLADKYGRKKIIQVIAALYILSAIWSTMAPSYYHLLAARFLGGLAFTSLSLAAMYIGEIAPTKMRGKLVAMNQINIVVGLSAAYFINYIILQASNSDASWVTDLGLGQNTWRWMLGAEIIPAILWFVLLFTIPRSPRWLVLQGHIEEARSVMARLMPAYQIEEEIAHIQKSIEKAGGQASPWTQFKRLIEPSLRVAFIIGLTFAIVQPITGINAILFYAPTVFEQVGLGTDAAFMQAVFVGLISLVFTILALLLIDKVGRRPLTLWGLLWAALSLGICAYGFHHATYTLTDESLATLPATLDTSPLQSLLGIEYDSDISFKDAVKQALGESTARSYESQLIQSAADLPASWILFGILSFIAAFQFSVGPVMWVIFSEIFPTRVRGVAIPAFALVTSIVSYLVQQFFPWQLSHMGASDIFLFYATASAIGLLAMYKYLPETKNKSIEEIEATLANKTSQKSASEGHLAPL